MKIVHIQTVVTQSGNAPYRLHNFLLERGIDSKIVTLLSNTDDKNIEIFNNKGKIFRIKKIFAKVLENFRLLKYHKKGKGRIAFSTGKYGALNVVGEDFIKNADVVHLHWTNGSFVSLEQLVKLTEMGKKIVWTFHDMWAFTGGCHYSGDCNKYEKACGGGCPILDSKKANDLAHEVFNNKLAVYTKVKFDVITCSNWLARCALNSRLLKGKNINVIHNVLNKEIFKSIDKNLARNILNLDLKKDKKYILFGAINALKDPRKGFQYLKEALQYFPKDDNVELLVFGANHCDDVEKLPIKVKFLGNVYEEVKLSLIYNAADVFILSSTADNLPNTILESIHCGTPVVAFDVGGISDMIVHKENGYLAKFKDAKDLGSGISFCLAIGERVKIISKKLDHDVIFDELMLVYKN